MTPSATALSVARAWDFVAPVVVPPSSRGDYAASRARTRAPRSVMADAVPATSRPCWPIKEIEAALHDLAASGRGQNLARRGRSCPRSAQACAAGRDRRTSRGGHGGRCWRTAWPPRRAQGGSAGPACQRRPIARTARGTRTKAQTEDRRVNRNVETVITVDLRLTTPITVTADEEARWARIAERVAASRAPSNLRTGKSRASRSSPAVAAGDRDPPGADPPDDLPIPRLLDAHDVAKILPDVAVSCAPYHEALIFQP